MNQKQLARLAFGIFAALVIAVGAFAGVSFAQGGMGPADALAITGAPMTAPPNSQTWFKFQEDGNASVVKIMLDAKQQPGILFRVYTPRSIADWIAQRGLKPIGVSSASPGNYLVWVGRFEGAGTYYAAVENSNPYPVNYTLTVTGEGVKTFSTPAPTPTPLPNPFETPVPVGELGDGKIVFQESSGGNIYTVNADGTHLQRVSFGIDPAFSPDGSKIAFAREGAIAGLFIANADGTSERIVYGANQVRSPTWMDDEHIIFSTVTGEKDFPPICFRGRCFDTGEFTKWSLKEYNLSTNAVVDVLTPATGGTVPSANPVLENIAFLNPEKGLMLTTLEDDAVPQVLNDDLSINTPAMSPDGARLTYMVSQPPAWQVVVAVWDGTNPTLLTRNDPLSFERADNVAPTFSPDGQEILFLSNRNGKWEFFAMNYDGSNLRQVLKNVTDTMPIQYDFAAARVASWVE